MITENDGTGTRETTAEVKMLADAGVKAFAVLNFTYTSANEVVEVDYVRVRKPDGTVVKTPDYNIQDMPGEVTRTAPPYSDIHEKHVAVQGLSVGDVLEYLVRFRMVKPEVRDISGTSTRSSRGNHQRRAPGDQCSAREVRQGGQPRLQA